MSAAPSGKPLAGRAVVVTRAREQARELVDRLEGLGAEVIVMPAVEFAEPEDTTELDKAVAGLATFDWVLLTSQNAVRFFCARVRKLGQESAGPRYAAVGPGTARSAEEEGLSISHTASKATGQALAADLAGKVKGKRVLLPRSDRARGDLPAALREGGADVVEVVAYRTLAAAADSRVMERLRKGGVDAMVFASPSAFHSVMDEAGTEAMSQIAERARFAALGPVTAAAIREAGFNVAIEAADSSAAGLADAIAEYYKQKSSTGARVP